MGYAPTLLLCTPLLIIVYVMADFPPLTGLSMQGSSGYQEDSIILAQMRTFNPALGPRAYGSATDEKSLGQLALCISVTF